MKKPRIICPDCGSEGVVTISEYYLWVFQQTAYYCRCTKCKRISHMFPTPEAAAAEWNPRK